MRPLLTAIVLAALALPAPAFAAPEDPPVEAVLPADGAVLPTNADGIEVRYTPGRLHVVDVRFRAAAVRADGRPTTLRRRTYGSCLRSAA